MAAPTVKENYNHCGNCSPYRSILDEINSIQNNTEDGGVEFLKEINQHLANLTDFFMKPTRLDHPRAIYPIYYDLNSISAKIHLCSIDSFKESWKNVLTSLNERKIYKIGVGESSFDTSIALNILIDGVNLFAQSIEITEYGSRSGNTRKKMVDFIRETDPEAFGTCFQKGFIDELLNHPEVESYVAKDNTGKIVGVLWGFYTKDTNNQSVFHMFELSRKATYGALKIGSQLVEELKKGLDKGLDSDCKFITLNVSSGNLLAINFYEKLDFKQSSNPQDPSKTSMSLALSKDSTPPLAKNINDFPRKYVIKAIFLPKLIGYEILRRIEQLFRAFWYNKYF